MFFKTLIVCGLSLFIQSAYFQYKHNYVNISANSNTKSKIDLNLNAKKKFNINWRTAAHMYLPSYFVCKGTKCVGTYKVRYTGGQERGPWNPKTGQ